MKTIILIFMSLLLACSKKEDAPKFEDKKKVEVVDDVEKVVEKKKEKASKFIELKYLKEDRPESLKFLGKAKHGLRWQDENGENWFILSASRAKHNGLSQIENLYATHAVQKGDDFKILSSVKQVKPKCEFDWNAAFEQRAVSILDLDGDGFGEVTFAYRTACTSDVSPSTYKLFVLENGEKNVLRGTDIIDAGKAIGDGKFTHDGFVQNKILLEHAERVWNRTVRVKL